MWCIWCTGNEVYWHDPLCRERRWSALPPSCSGQTLRSLWSDAEQWHLAIGPYWDWVLGHCWWSRLPTSCWACFLIMRLINMDDDRGPWGGYHLCATMHNASRCQDSRLGFLGTTYHILSCDSIVFCEVWWNTDAFHSSSSSSLFGHHQ